MASPPFYILHIRYNAADSLSFRDLLSCICVNQQWYDSFIPVLWADHIAFRSKPTRQHQTWTQIDCTNISNGRLALQKHAHHIHAPTCQETESLRVLRNMNCVNLTEMNFIVNSTASTDNDPWADALFYLAAVNPRLTAISLENLSLLDPSTEVQTNRFLDLLDQNPATTNVYFGTNAQIQDTSVVERLRVVQGRLLARAPPKTVRTLCARDAIPRSG